MLACLEGFRFRRNCLKAVAWVGVSLLHGIGNFDVGNARAATRCTLRLVSLSAPWRTAASWFHTVWQGRQRSVP